MLRQTAYNIVRATNCTFRKTGITLEDRGVRDDNGLEPISGIFSSPEKSPPKRGSTVTGSESMDIQESTCKQAQDICALVMRIAARMR